MAKADYDVEFVTANAAASDIEKDIARDGSLTEAEEAGVMTDLKALRARLQEIATRVGETATV